MQYVSYLEVRVRLLYRLGLYLHILNFIYIESNLYIKERMNSANLNNPLIRGSPFLHHVLIVPYSLPAYTLTFTPLEMKG